MGQAPDIRFSVVTNKYHCLMAQSHPDDILGELGLRFRRLNFFSTQASASPSSEANNTQFHEAQQRPDTVVFCGRPHEYPVPPSLYDESLCKFRYNLMTITPSPADIQCFQDLRAAGMETYENEESRRERFTTITNDSGILPEDMKIRPGAISKYCDDGDIRLGEDLILYVQEVTLDVGESGANPFHKAISHFKENARVVYSRHPDWNHVNYPAVLLIHFGEYLLRAD